MAERVSLTWTDRSHLAAGRRAQEVGAGYAAEAARHLQTMALDTWQTSVETKRAREAMERVGWSVEGVADRIDNLERTLGLKLDEQTRILEQQAQLLAEIRDTLLTPAKTRAAERVADAAQLLSRARFDRALTIANEGIEADPTNPGVFVAAGWALLGLERPDEARAMFEEGRDAANGDERSRAARQAARAALASGNPSLAYALARDARQLADSNDERAAVAYDVAVYAWITGDHESAADLLEAACRHDSRFCEMALLDRNLTRADELRNLAAHVLAELADPVAKRRPTLEAQLRKVRDSLPPPPRTRRSHEQLGTRLRPRQDWREIRDAITTHIETADRELGHSREADTLQQSLSALDAGAAAASAAEGRVSELGAVIAEHDRAAEHQTALEAERDAVESRRRSWANIASSCWRLKSHRGALIGWGVVLLLIGIALGPLAVIGVLMIASVAGAYLVGAIAKSNIAAQDQRINTINAEING
jgi:tetratricopeptide (TPR) repeat protein